MERLITGDFYTLCAFFELVNNDLVVFSHYNKYQSDSAQLVNAWAVCSKLWCLLVEETHIVFSKKAGATTLACLTQDTLCAWEVAS